MKFKSLCIVMVQVKQTKEDMSWKDHFLLSGWYRLSIFGQAVEFETRLILASLDDCNVSLISVDADAVMFNVRFFAVEAEGELQDSIVNAQR